MNAEEELSDALVFFAKAVNAALAVLGRRLDALETSMIRLDPFYRPPALTDEEKKELIEKIERGDIP